MMSCVEALELFGHLDKFMGYFLRNVAYAKKNDRVRLLHSFD